jgi:MYXO-CTERM domain-containing protein
MKRSILAFVLLVGLALAPSAAAKGPHALVEPGPGGIGPGEPWVTTLSLIEFGAGEVAAARPVVIFRSGRERFTVRPKRVGAHIPTQPDVMAETRYRLRVVFPRAGRWSYTVLDGTAKQRRFHFPAVAIGGNTARDRTAYVAFPEGSPEEAQGAGGPVLGYGAPSAGGESLPPEVVVAAADDGGDGGGFPVWIPAAGLALAGAGTLTAVRRRRR